MTECCEVDDDGRPPFLPLLGEDVDGLSAFKLESCVGVCPTGELSAAVPKVGNEGIDRLRGRPVPLLSTGEEVPDVGEEWDMGAGRTEVERRGGWGFLASERGVTAHEGVEVESEQTLCE